MATITAAAGGGNWSATTTWTGGVVPTAADDVKLASTSGAVTINANSVCRSLDCTGYTSTLTHTAAFTLSIGDGTAGASNIALKLVSGMAFSGGSSNATIAFVSTSATQQTITTAGKSIGAMSFTTAGNWLLSDALTIGSGGTLTHTAGTLDTGGQTLSIGFYAGNSSTARTLTLGASTVTLTATSGTVWNLGTNITNLTFNCGTSTIKNSGTNVTMAFNTLTYYIIDVSTTTITIGGVFTCNTFKCQPAAGTGAMILVSAGFTAGSLVLSCTDSGTVGGRGWITPSTTPAPNSTRTINVTGSATLANFDFTDVALTGTGAPFSGTNLGDGWGNSGITFAAARTLYWVGTATAWTSLSRWATASGNSNGSAGTVHIPVAHDNVVFDGNSAIVSGTSVACARTMGRNVDMSAVNTNITFNQTLSPGIIFGNFAAKSDTVVSGTGQLVLIGRGSQTLTTNGCTFSTTGQFNIVSPGGTYTLQDDLTVTGAGGFGFGAGTLDHNGKNVTTTSFLATATNTRTWKPSSGTLTLTGTGTVLSVSDVNLTFVTGTGTIFASNTSAITGRTLNFPNGSSITMNNVVLAANISTIISWAGVTAGHTGNINNLTVNGPTTLQFISGQTTVFNNAPVINSGSSSVVTINASTAGTAATLNKTSGVASYDYLSIKDSTATAGASWYAGSHSTNVSNNSGWFFSDRPLAAFMPFF